MSRTSLFLTLAALALAQDRRVVPGGARTTLGATGKRIALVVGNDSYRPLPRLANGVRDAEAIGAALHDAAGFQATVLTDATREVLEAGVDRFIAAIEPGDVALFYFSGHGVQIGADNYLLPVDLAATDEVQTRHRALKAGELVERMEARGAALEIVILDACRDNPFGARRGIGGQGGLAPMNAGRGTFLAYATAPGKTASDNGLYRQYLVAALGRTGLTIEQVFKEVSGQVQRASGATAREVQIPWVASSLDGDFYFVGGPAVTAGGSGRPADEAAYEFVKDSNRRELLEQFLKEYPQSAYAGAVRLRISMLTLAQPAGAPMEPVPVTATGPTGVKTKMNPKDGLTYVWIPPGTFTMGCSPGDNDCTDGEKPAHRVTISKGFWLGQTAVTQEAYQRVAGTNPSHFQGSRLPVEMVDWEEAHTYCKAIGGRLPTEAEWEYAARGGTTSVRYGNLDDIAWYQGNSGNRTQEVGQKQANAFGLFDMLGNVWQWTADWYGPYPAGAVTDPAGPANGTVRTPRGGSWYGNPRVARASGRSSFAPSLHDYRFGLRCVAE